MDTNALVWFMDGDQLDAAALVAIVDAQNSHGIFVSPISAWEAALAVRKPRGQPDLGGLEFCAMVSCSANGARYETRFTK